MSSSLEVNPIIARLGKVQSGDAVVELQGYVGSVDGDTIRLYAGLDLKGYYEFAKADVLESVAVAGCPAGKVRVFIRSSATVTLGAAILAADIATRIPALDWLNPNYRPCRELAKAKEKALDIARRIRNLLELLGPGASTERAELRAISRELEVLWDEISAQMAQLGCDALL